MRELDTAVRQVNRHRYATLDGLRGCAAVMVVLFHAGQNLGTWTPRFGYLAVDLFFLLSGFVLAHSYDSRFRRGMTAAEFLLIRFVRLYPLYLLGLVLGAGLALFDFGLPGLTLEGDAIGFCFGLVGLPSYVLPHGQVIFALNVPFWSLFFEFWVANLIFVLFRRMLNWKTLLVVIVLCGIGLFMSERYFYTMNVGPSWRDFAGGFLRVGFSFFFGVALSRLHSVRPPKLKLPSWLFVLSLPILLSLPLEGGLAHRYELLCVLAIFPCLVYWGSVALERRPWLGTTLGDASYALYTVHYPLLLLASSMLFKYGLDRSIAPQVFFVLAMVLLAWGLSIIDVWVRASFLSRIKPIRLPQGGSRQEAS